MMESEVTGNCHASFGERDRETHKSRGLKVRSVPTLFSPLLANIALHGMEARVMQYAETLKGNKRKNRDALSLIRYADDFVIIHKDLNVLLKCKEIIADWLSDMGLELKPSKTRLTHTLNEIDGNIGFEFLGFHIQQHKTGNYRCAVNPHGTPLGFTTLITPSKAKIKSNLQRIPGL